MNPVAGTDWDAASAFHPLSSSDYLPREQLRMLQSQRLRRAVCQVYQRVPWYRQRMEKQGLKPADIRGVEDLCRLPFTSKADLQDTYPCDLFAVPLEKVAHLHPASGSPKKPIVVAFTRRDLRAAVDSVVRCLAACGIRQGAIVQDAWASLSGHGLDLDAAARMLKATVIPLAGEHTDHNVMVMKNFGVSAVCGTPGYYFHLVERAAVLGVDLREAPLRIGVFAGEPWSEAIRGRIENSARIKAYQVYVLAELAKAVLGTECLRQEGLHIFEDHFYPEVVDPVSGDPVADGQEGVLVLTTLSREGMPLIRYRTAELAAIWGEPCPCGRTLRRIRRAGRRSSDDVFVVDCVSVSPAQIEAVLLAAQGTLPPYQIVLSQENGRDRAEVQMEVTGAIFTDQVGAVERLQNKLIQELERALGVRLPLRFVEPHTIERSGGGVNRVLDKRGT
jgi:phenylacetate-CoA ligase